MKNLIIFLLVLLCILEKTNAQCGTKTPTKDHLEGKVLLNMPANTTFRYRVFITILRNTDGTNAACTETEALNAISEMNTRFSPTICFNLMGFKYLNNTKLNTDMDTENSTDKNSLISNNEGGCIDIYIHKSGLRAGSLQINGTAYDIPNHYLSIDSFGNNVLSHEMGHCFGLLHTHETAHGTERVNGSNCGIAGDLVCDTAADPDSDRTCRTESACGYTGNCTDINNASYSPPVNNLMSYYGCKTLFTGGQNSRMINTILYDSPGTFANNGIESENVFYPLNPLIGTTISSGIETYATGGDMVFGSTSFLTATYTVTPTGTLYAQATKVRLLPGFHVTAGTNGKVRIKTLTCN